MAKETLVVNLYGGPGTGKSTIMAGLFNKLKWAKVDCEMAPEYAKEIVWEGATEKFKDQDAVFEEQLKRITRVLGKVDVVITDSPILLSLYYDPNKEPSAFKDKVLAEYKKMNNLDVFLKRKKEYNPNGRYQTEEQAKTVDQEVMTIVSKISTFLATHDGVQETEEELKNLILDIGTKRAFNNYHSFSCTCYFCE